MYGMGKKGYLNLNLKLGIVWWGKGKSVMCRVKIKIKVR